MEINLILAIDAANGIGLDGGLPWHLPKDLARFRDLTMGQPVIMGSSTYLSIGRPLPGRKLIVLSRNTYLQLPPHIEVATSIGMAYSFAAKHSDKVFVIGGAQVFKQTFHQANNVFLTRIAADYHCDVKVDPSWFHFDNFDLESSETFPASGDKPEYVFENYKLKVPIIESAPAA